MEFERNQIFLKIKELSLRRQQHEKIIQKLINSSQQSTQSNGSFYQIDNEQDMDNKYGKNILKNKLSKNQILKQNNINILKGRDKKYIEEINNDNRQQLQQDVLSSRIENLDRSNCIDLHFLNLQDKDRVQLDSGHKLMKSNNSNCTNNRKKLTQNRQKQFMHLLSSQTNNHINKGEQTLKQIKETESKNFATEIKKQKWQSQQRIGQGCTDRTDRTCGSNISRQVNLESYLNFNTQQKRSNGNNQISLPGTQSNLSKQKTLKHCLDTFQASKHPQTYKIAPTKQILSNNHIITSDLTDFNLIVEFLTERALWDDIFWQRDDAFYAGLCGEFLSVSTQQNMSREFGDGDRCEEIVCLSSQPLMNYEEQLVFFCQPELMDEYQCRQQDQFSSQHKSSNSSQKSNKKSSEKQIQLAQSHSTKMVCIGYLLLYRLLNYLGTGFAPQIFQYLFGYPYKIYQIGKTEQYFQFIGQLSHNFKDPNTFMYIGQNRYNNRLQKIPTNKLLSQNPHHSHSPTHLHNQILKTYTAITKIHTIACVSFKKLEIIHKRNHHVVVDLENTSNREMGVYLSFVTRSSGVFVNPAATNGSGWGFSSKCSIGKFGPVKNLASIGYKYCLVNQQTQIIKYSQNIQLNKQPVYIKLKAHSQYKLYISQVSTQSDPISYHPISQPDLPQFTLLLQSPTPITALNLQLKFNESYNTMTETLINKYLKQYCSSCIDEVEKEMIRLSEIGPQTQILIVRANLNFMGLAVDFICFGEQAKRKVSKMWIQYEGKEVLCDCHYRENKKKIVYKQPEIYQVYLSKRADIVSCSGFSYKISQVFL